MELVCSYVGGQTVEPWTCSVVMVADCRTVDLFSSHGGRQTVELWNCSLAALDVVHVVLCDFIF